MAYSTVRLYITAIGFNCKSQAFDDVTKHYLISKTLEGLKRVKLPQVDVRLPISPQILVKVLSKLPVVCTNEYESKLFAAVYSLAFFGFFRVGEVTVAKGRSEQQILGLDDIKLVEDRNYIMVNVRYSKTDQLGKGVSLKIGKVGGIVCPVNNLLQYLEARPRLLGPLFIHFNGQPVSRYQFSAVLKKSLRI